MTVAIPTSLDGHDFGGRLLEARAPETQEILRTITGETAVVVTGEHDVGKTRLVLKATAPLALGDDRRVAYLDLRRTTSDTRLAWEWFRAVAKAIAGPVAFSHMVAMAQATWPGKTRGAALDVRRVIGEFTDWALADRPEPLAPEQARVALHAARAATIASAAERPTVLVVDHAEAPSDAPRMPIDVEQLFWGLRPGSAPREQLHLVAVCHPAYLRSIAGSQGPLLGVPVIEVKQPPVSIWRTAVTSDGFDERVVDEAFAHTRGHVPSMVLLLWTLVSDPSATPGAAFSALARTQHQHVQRCLRHAATLHRHGAQLFETIARGERPYQASPDVRSTRDVSQALNALWRAGLVVHPETGRWEIANPFVAHLLRDG